MFYFIFYDFYIRYLIIVGSGEILEDIWIGSVERNGFRDFIVYWGYMVFLLDWFDFCFLVENLWGRGDEF